MKRKTFSILFALVLVLSFGLVTAVPVAAQETIPITGDVAATLVRTDALDTVTFDIEILSAGPHYGVGVAFATSLDNPAFQVWYREYEEPYGWFYQDWTGTGWNGWGGDVVPLSEKTDFSATGDHTGQTFSISVPTGVLGGFGATYYYAVQVRTNLISVYPGGWSWGSPVSAYASVDLLVLNENTGMLYGTIQAAINAASNGDTIMVSDGTYYENVIVNKELTIKAASSPVVDGGGSGACFGIYKGSGLDDVTIDGFEIQNATYGIWIYGDGASSTTYNNIAFTNNNIHDHINNGILTTDATVNSLTISGSTVDNSGIGISFDRATVVGLTVDADIITNGNAGLSFFSGSYTDITVSNCYFEGNAWEHIDLGAWGKWPTLSNVSITGCQFLSGPWCGVSIQANFTPITDVRVQFNEFFTNQWGVFNDTSPIVDATCNWWGDVSGPYNPWDTDELNQVNSGSGDVVSEYVLYDPWIGQAGMVTGGGWFDSPEGAYSADPELVGKATFGFISKNKKEQTPAGNTQFVFKTADLNFHSSSYDWLVITGSGYAKFKGSGTINGMGDCKFMIWAGDGDPDTFRIKIWEEDEFDNETVVYDNGFDQEIGGGSIVIHKK